MPQSVTLNTSDKIGNIFVKRHSIVNIMSPTNMTLNEV